MSQRMLTLQGVRDIVGQVKFKDRYLVVGEMGNGAYVQVQYYEPCVDTGEHMLQCARKWYISLYSTESEVVETCFKALRTSNEHVLKEHFTYKGRRVYSPHFDVNARIELCDAKRYDARED